MDEWVFLGDDNLAKSPGVRAFVINSWPEGMAGGLYFELEVWELDRQLKKVTGDRRQWERTGRDQLIGSVSGVAYPGHIQFSSDFVPNKDHKEWSDYTFDLQFFLVDSTEPVGSFEKIKLPSACFHGENRYLEIAVKCKGEEWNEGAMTHWPWDDTGMLTVDMGKLHPFTQERVKLEPDDFILYSNFDPAMKGKWPSWGEIGLLWSRDEDRLYEVPSAEITPYRRRREVYLKVVNASPHEVVSNEYEQASQQVPTGGRFAGFPRKHRWWLALLPAAGASFSFCATKMKKFEYFVQLARGTTTAREVTLKSHRYPHLIERLEKRNRKYNPEKVLKKRWPHHVDVMSHLYEAQKILERQRSWRRRKLNKWLKDEAPAKLQTDEVKRRFRRILELEDEFIEDLVFTGAHAAAAGPLVMIRNETDEKVLAGLRHDIAKIYDLKKRSPLKVSKEEWRRIFRMEAPHHGWVEEELSAVECMAQTYVLQDAANAEKWFKRFKDIFRAFRKNKAAPGSRSYKFWMYTRDAISAVLLNGAGGFRGAEDAVGNLAKMWQLKHVYKQDKLKRLIEGFIPVVAKNLGLSDKYITEIDQWAAKYKSANPDKRPPADELARRIRQHKHPNMPEHIFGGITVAFSAMALKSYLEESKHDTQRKLKYWIKVGALGADFMEDVLLVLSKKWHAVGHAGHYLGAVAATLHWVGALYKLGSDDYSGIGGLSRYKRNLVSATGYSGYLSGSLLILAGSGPIGWTAIAVGTALLLAGANWPGDSDWMKKRLKTITDHFHAIEKLAKDEKNNLTAEQRKALKAISDTYFSGDPDSVWDRRVVDEKAYKTFLAKIAALDSDVGSSVKGVYGLEKLTCLEAANKYFERPDDPRYKNVYKSHGIVAPEKRPGHRSYLNLFQRVAFLAASAPKSGD